MKYRKLGKDGPGLSVVGLGTWALGGGGWKYGWGNQADSDSIETVAAAMDKGINWVDTAPVYGLGKAEKILGRAMKKLSVRPFIATKCGLVWDDKRNISHILKRESIVRECEQSLRRLGLETIDLYQIHWPQPQEDIEEAWDTLDRLRKQGKIRCAGVSNFSQEQVKRIDGIAPVMSAQLPLNLRDRRIVDSGFAAYCRDRSVSILAYGPLMKGLLTGKVSSKWVEELDFDDHRKRAEEFRGSGLTRNLRLAAKVKDISEQAGLTPAQLAIAWVISNPGVTAAIVGARHPGQVIENTGAAAAGIGPEVFAELANISGGDM